MNTEKPFLIWISYKDPTFIKDDEDSGIYFYQTLVLTMNKEEALVIGKEKANKLIQNGEAEYIDKVWLEEFHQSVVSRNGSQQINWYTITDEIIKQYYQGCAEYINDSNFIFNTFIEATSVNDAMVIFNDYLSEQRPDYKPTTCSNVNFPLIRK